MNEARCPKCGQLIDASSGSNVLCESIRCEACGWTPARDAAATEPVGLRTGELVSKIDVTSDIRVGGTTDLARTETAEVDTVIDRRVAHFELKRQLGSGGFGAVWLADDLNLEREVALKLPKHVGSDSLLLYEARTAAKLHHPNIVTVHEVGLEGDQVYIASEYIDGATLRGEMNRGRLSTGRGVDLMITLARAADHAHQQGIIHRDLKPTNVMINSAGEPFIADFGIAKQLSAEKTISSEGAVVGTFSYMSPEQAEGKTRETDHRADIYALGVILFELLTDYRPFRGNVEAIIRQKINDDAPSPRRLVATIAPDLETICLKCLERDRNKRYQSAIHLAEELERFREGIPILARPISHTEKAWRWCRRKPVVAGLTAGIFLSLLIGLSGTSYFWARAVENEAQTRQALYRAQMNLIGTRWISGDLSGIRSALTEEPVRTMSGESDDFAYRYYSTALKPFRQIVNHGEAVVDVAVSHNGKMFASAGRDNTILVWNSDDGKLVRTLQVASGKISNIEFATDDNRLASSHVNGRIRIWNPKQHDRVLREFTHLGVTHVRFAGSGKLLSGSRRGDVLRWDVAEGSSEKLFQRKSPVVDLRASPDGSQAAVAFSDAYLSLLDLVDGGERALPRCPNVLCVCFLPDGDGLKLLAGRNTASCHVYDLETNSLKRAFKLEGAVGDLEYLPGIGRFALASSKGWTQIFDREFRDRCSLTTHVRTYGMLAQSADGSSLAIGSADGLVKLLDVERFRRADTMWYDSNLRDVTFINDSEVVTCAGDGAVHLWNLESDARRELAAPTDFAALALARIDSRGVIASAGTERTLDLLPFDADGESSSFSLPHAGIAALSFDQRGLLATGARNGRVLVYSADRFDAPYWETAQADAAVNDLQFAPDGSPMAAAYSNQLVGIYEPTDQGFRETLIEVGDEPTALAFYRKGEMLAVATQTGEMLLISTREQRVVRQFKCHGSRINSLAALPNDRQIVSGGRDRYLYLWDIASGKMVAKLPGHNRQIFSLAVSPNGQTIASVGLEGDLRVWRGQ